MLNTFTKKRVILILSFMLISISVFAQRTYGNEWINHTQQYYKLKVVQTGLYRLDHAYLSSLGLASVNPKHFQLFRRGQEVPLYVAGEADGSLDAQDFIEFYGERNDGALDSELYKDPSHQVHQLYSLYTDTAAYFLTVNPAGGKRMREENPSAYGRTPEPYHLQKSVYVNTDRFNLGKLYDIVNKQVYLPWFDEGEGYFSHFSINPRNYSIWGIRDIEPNGPKPLVEYATVGAYQEYHNFSVNILPANGGARQLKSFAYDMFGYARDRKQIEFSDVSSQGAVTLQVVPVPTPGRGNAISFSYGIVTYPQKPVFAGSSMFIYTDSTRSASPYFEFPSLSSSVVAYDVTDINNYVRIEGQVNGTGKGFVVDGSSISHKILLANTSQALSPVGKADRINFRKIDPAAHNYIVLSNKRLSKTLSETGVPAPKAYAAYRASEAGGSYDTLLVYVDDVINQFHYGDYSANAIIRFSTFMASSKREKQMFLLGKGIEYSRANYRSPETFKTEFVPTVGKPASDIIFSADFTHNSLVPAIPTGRLSATSGDDILNYLTKVKQYEATPENLSWRKNILQLGGGKTREEIKQIASYLSNYTQIAEGPFIGANVIEKYRQNVSEVVETINVAEELNKGLSLITFFGHSSPSTTDLDIGNVSAPGNNYKNEGKYPVMLMNGCNIGNAFLPGVVSFGEDWLNTANKGAISLIAHSDAGYANYLSLYSYYFYSSAFQNSEMYGATIGKVQQETIRSTLQTNSDEFSIAMVMEMSLHGDPAIKLYSPDKPDYHFTDNSFSIADSNGESVTAALDEFNITFNVGNLGKAIQDSITVSVKRTLADNTVLPDHQLTIAPIIKAGAVSIRIPNKDINALGINKFEVKLDSPENFEELDESNNIATFQHFFPVSGLLALSPANYGIVSTDKVKLQAQATEIQANKQGYYFELDTTQNFNSSLKQTRTVSHTLLPTWEVSLPKGAGDTDSTVYYWRVRFQTYAASEDTVWTTNSFRYIPNSQPGWSQSHYGQFSKAKTDKVENEGKQNLKWEFRKTKAEISLKTIGGDFRYNNPPYGLYFNGEMLMPVACSNPAGSSSPRIFAIVVHDKTLQLVEKLGSSFCSSSPTLYEFGDMNHAASRDRFTAFVNAVPEGYYVVAMTVNRVPFESFSATQKAAFTALGSNLINNLKNGHPFAIIGRKGAAVGTINEITGATDSQTPITSQAIFMDDVINSRQPAGTITSSLIGPSLSWGQLHHNVETYKDGDDAYILDVLGVKPNGQEDKLIENVSSKEFDLSGIDAKAYPNIRLQVALQDEQDRSAPQLNQWYVYYATAPEGIVIADMDKLNTTVLTQQARSGGLKLPISFQNISSTAFPDSVTVQVTLSNNTTEPKVTQFKIKPVGADERVDFEYTMSTAELEGNYKLSIYVNPRVLPEQHYTNNIFEVAFQTKTKLHPILDVAFDGTHIMDGELVSPSPLISVTIKDENQFNRIKDPSGILMVMTSPDGQKQEVPLMSTSSEVKYFPADDKNDFRVEFKPERLENGKHLLEVSAKDKSGKASGVVPYKINFEVENASKITNFYPFPNPFSTKTNFIFTLTGSEVPEHLKIQILTVTGKVVKEITKEEIGPIKIGNNKTEYAWDGTDTYGDKLANGVYLYRVVMSQVEDRMKHMYKTGDKSFKNGYGKIYILR